MTEEKFSDEQVTLYMAVFHSMAALVGAQTARLNGAKDDDPFAVPEAAWDGVQAMASRSRTTTKSSPPASLSSPSRLVTIRRRSSGRQRTSSCMSQATP